MPLVVSVSILGYILFPPRLLISLEAGTCIKQHWSLLTLEKKNAEKEEKKMKKKIKKLKAKNKEKKKKKI